MVALSERGVPSYNVLSDVAYDHIVIDETVCRAICGVNADIFYFNTLIQPMPENQDNLSFCILDVCDFSEIVCDINR